MANMIITIGRQYGSGGREIGQKIAKNMGIAIYDKEMLSEAAKESGICEELFETHDEKPTNSFLYSLVMDTYSMGGYPAGGTFGDMPLNQKVFLAQFDTIKKIADRESCILVGRCADYALEDYKSCTKVFIYADLDKRVQRIAGKYNLTDAKAKEKIIKTDKRRSSYYNYYSNKRWGMADSYNLCVNSAILGIDGTAKLIEEYVKKRQELDFNTQKL